MFRWALRAAFLGSAGALLAACSTSSLSPSIKAFADTMTTAGASFQTQQNEARTAILEESLASASQGTRVHEYPEECDPDAARCRLFIKRDGEQWPFTKDAVEQGLATLMAGLVSYSQGLAAIADAKSASDVATATAATRAAALSLAGSVDALTNSSANAGLEARIAPFATPVTELASAGLNLYLEQRKLAGLREAVGEMELHIDAATDLFAKLAALNRDYKITTFDDKYRVARVAYRNNMTDRSKLLALRSAAEDYDLALRSKPDAMFVDIRKAHAALAEALAKKDLSFANVWPLLQEVIRRGGEAHHPRTEASRRGRRPLMGRLSGRNDASQRTDPSRGQSRSSGDPGQHDRGSEEADQGDRQAN